MFKKLEGGHNKYMSVGLCARASAALMTGRVEGEPAIIVHENRTPDTVVTSC